MPMQGDMYGWANRTRMAQEQDEYDELIRYRMSLVTIEQLKEGGYIRGPFEKVCPDCRIPTRITKEALRCKSCACKAIGVKIYD